MYYFILNPNSRSAGAAEVWPKVHRTLHQRGIDHLVFATRHAGHATEIAREISRKDPEAVIVVVGGDGSIHETLNGLENLGTVTLGIIPCGSGNDFVRGMKISSDTDRALDAILARRKVVQMDVGRVHQGSRTLRFGVSTGIGFDASVCHEAFASPIKNALNGLGFGHFAYSAIAVKQIALFDPCNVKIMTGGGRSFHFSKVFFVAVMNQKYEGGGCMMTPGAHPDDGVLDVFVCGGISRGTLVAALPLARFGAHTKIPGLHFLRCRSVEIETAKKYPIHLDGESGGVDRFLKIDLEPEKLNVIVS